MSLTEMGSAAAGDPTYAPPRLRRRWALAVFGLLIAACVVAGLAALAAANAEAWAAHTITVRERAAMLIGAVTATETAERGYLLTGQDSYRADYDEARRRIPVLQAQLAALTDDNPDQARRLAALAPDLKTRVAFLDRAMVQERTGRSSDALAQMKLGQGRRLTGRISAAIDAVSAEEQALYDRRSGWANLQRVGSLAAILFSIFAAMGLAVSAGRTARRYRRTLEANNAALAREIAERERTEGQLRQAQKVEALGRLTGGVAHDFNNVLAIIIGNLDLALKRIEEERPRRMVSSALEGAQRAAALTQRLLAFSRQQPLEPRSMDVNRCVVDTSNLLHRVLGETITIETVLGAGAWRAMVDPSQLESAIVNLAINARDAMPDGGKLTLETSNTYLDQAYAEEHEEVAPGQYVMLAITDTGTGMSAEVISKAFDPFFTTKPVGSGTGLGLSQVYGFIKQSGGHVKLYSEIGVGTSVKLYLPRSLARGDAPAEAAGAVARQDMTGLSVLVVEDAAQVREFAVEALEHLGYRTHQADGAEAALGLLNGGVSVDLLLTDVVMPGLNGRKLAEEALRLQRGLRVLYMTGYTRNAIVHNGVLDTGTHLLTKPFTVAQLDRALKAALDGDGAA
jgi:signal transduction histidine kinase/ActR/RegA family two-component response regulator